MHGFINVYALNRLHFLTQSKQEWAGAAEPLVIIQRVSSMQCAWLSPSS